MKDIYQKFKELTGVSSIGIANVLGCTRQNVSMMFKSNAKTGRAALAFAMNEIIKERIELFEQKIEKLKELQEDIILECKKT